MRWGIFKQAVRRLLKTWISSGVKTGYVYWFLDKYPALYASEEPIKTQLRNNLSMNCVLRDHVQSRIYFFGAYEPIETYLLSSLLKEDTVFLDVGANVGFYSLMLSQVCKRGKVYAFEPVDKNFAVLQKNIFENKLENVVTAVPKGLWSETTTLEFSIPDGVKNNLGTYSAGTRRQSQDKVRCDVTTLDEFVANTELSRLDAIKMDIEGAELFALRGAEKTLNTFRPILQIELNALACKDFGYVLTDLESILKAHDYVFYKIGHTAERSGFITSFAGIDQVNVLALPVEKKHMLNTQWVSRDIFRSFLNQ